MCGGCDPDADGSIDTGEIEEEGECRLLSGPTAILGFFAGRLSDDSESSLRLRFFRVVPSCCKIIAA